jgi:hypothetical protein
MAQLDTTQMRLYLTGVWARFPLIQVLHGIHVDHGVGTLAGEALQRQVLSVLDFFQSAYHVPVQFVPEGMVQACRGPGNYSSLRSRRGVLQIERQLLRNPEQLLTEITHEICYHFVGGPGEVHRLGESPLSALELLEIMVTHHPRQAYNLLAA